MICPKCSGEMEPVTHANIEVDRCCRCFGIWFDMLEEEHLKRIAGSEQIDIGEPAVGQAYNRQADVECPRCGERMIPMVDRLQPHIWYESCPVCYGVFFDAGEFRDYRRETVLDFFRDLFTGGRS